MAQSDKDTARIHDGSPGPPARHNIAAAALLLIVLVGVTAFLLGLAVSVFSGAATGQGGIGRFFLLILDSDIDPKVLTGITAIVGVGSAFVAGGGLSDRFYYSIVALCAVSVLLALIVWLLLTDDHVARNFYNFASARLADAEDFRGAFHWVLGGTILWLLGVLGAQFGLRLAR